MAIGGPTGPTNDSSHSTDSERPPTANVQRLIGRRRVLIGMGAATATAGAVGLGLPVLANASSVRGSPTSQAHSKSAASDGAERQWAMVIDLRKCEGCVTKGQPPACTEGCNLEHSVPPGQEWIRVMQIEGAAGHPFFLPLLCQQCENAPCVSVCPVGATYADSAGIVLIDHDKCIGCRMCMAACPYGVRFFNWGEPPNPPEAELSAYSPQYPVPHRRGTVNKCMLCAHHLAHGKLPACADACPMYAIYLADRARDVATNGKEVVQFSTFIAENNAFRLKAELGTSPRVWYIPGHGEEFGHDVTVHSPMKPARTWIEQRAAKEAKEKQKANAGGGGS